MTVKNNEDLLFSANFDSGNLAQVQKLSLDENSELLNELPSSYTTGNYSVIDFPGKIDYEYLVWTRPDCFGSSHENANRTWFYFAVKRYEPQKFIRITIMNMNKQSRLYGQGYAPFFKTIHSCVTMPKWLRVRERTSFDFRDGEFRLTFVHQFQEPIDGITLFAFCFPWSYTDCQKSLYYLDQRFIYMDSFPNIMSMKESMGNGGENGSISPDSIYYYRELFCYSLDKLRIDLITITDFFGIQLEREAVYDLNLFPESQNYPRCHKFKQKRIVFVSSRVHPGETPASHVFNGFLDFITRESDPRARLLRRQYVFKLVPFLNPDGVRRGHYRTDSLGVNLNRMYLNPQFHKHPSIYAVKSLLVYHHINNRIKYKETNNRPTATKSVLNNSKKAKSSFNNNADANYQPHTKRTPNVSTNNNLPFYERVNSYKEIHESFQRPMQIISSKRIRHLQSFRRILFENKNNSNSPNVNVNLKDRVVCKDQAVNEYFDKNDNLSNDDSLSDCNQESVQEDNVLHSPHLCDPKLLEIPWTESGVALYIDLHGHCSKKGCFIYGNHIENEEAMIENLLYPRLIALNTPHFDFSSCNFTIKNMICKDKRDGLSKIGAGRVAIMKHLGLVNSYTLECNYNSGRNINQIVPISGGDVSISPTPFVGYPYRYTPSHYINVGKAMAIAMLDMTDRNPLSRIINSDLRTLTRARDILRRHLQGISKVSFGRNNFSRRSSSLPSMAQIDCSTKPYSSNVAFGTGITSNKAASFSKTLSSHQFKPARILSCNYKSSNFRLQKNRNTSEQTRESCLIRNETRNEISMKANVVENIRNQNNCSNQYLTQYNSLINPLFQKSKFCQTDHQTLNATMNISSFKQCNTSKLKYSKVKSGDQLMCYDATVDIDFSNNNSPH